MNQTLFAADQTWALAAILFGAGAFGLWAEGRGWARYFSGAVIAIAVTFAFSNLAVIPVAAPIYDWVWSYCVPFAIPLLLLRADLRRLLGESGPMVGAFALGAVGTVLGVLLMAKPTLELAGVAVTDYGLGAIDALPVGLLVWAIGLGLGGPTGFAINPARDLGPRLVFALVPRRAKASPDWGYAWVPVAGPALGAALAALVFTAVQ